MAGREVVRVLNRCEDALESKRLGKKRNKYVFHIREWNAAPLALNGRRLALYHNRMNP